MKRAVYLMFVFCIGSIHSIAQNFPYKKLKEGKFSGSIDRISVDRLGGFYLVTNCGINQYDPEGNELSSYRPRGCTPTELFEAWGYARLYGFQKAKSQLTVFNKDLELLEPRAIDPAFAVEPQLAAPASYEHSYWILDVDNSIKKINTNTNSVEFESDTLLGMPHQFAHMRDYQNLFFLLDKNTGIFVFNKFGKLISRLAAQGVTYFNFAGEDLYFVENNTLRFINIYSKDAYEIPLPEGVRFCVVTDERLVLIKEKHFEVYEFKLKG